MAKRSKAEVSKFFQSKLPPDIVEYFRVQGARGGKIGGKRSLETMTAAERQARARKAGQAKRRKPAKTKG